MFENIHRMNYHKVLVIKNKYDILDYFKIYIWLISLKQINFTY